MFYHSVWKYFGLSVLLEKLFTSRNAMLINALFLTLIVTTVLLLLLVHHKSDFIPGVSP